MVQPSMTFHPTERHLKTSKLLLCMPTKMISSQSWLVMQEFIIGWRFTRDTDRVLVFAVFFFGILWVDYASHVYLHRNGFMREA